MPGLFHSILKITRKFLVEKDDHLARRKSIFRAAEAEDIYTRLPGNRFRSATDRRDCIGKTRAVHVKQHFVRARETPNSRDFVRCVHGSKLRCLCDANSAHHMPV